MKIWRVLFGFIILLQNFTPCGDELMRHPDEAFITHIEQEHTQKDASSDTCSPFCACVCCTSPTALKQDITVSAVTTYFKDLSNIVENQGKLIDISLPVWQPPQSV
ncbi:MAG: DUF6660 family protein [Sphingobacteriaceae bacterium]